jgi:beta-galactosidase
MKPSFPVLFSLLFRMAALAACLAVPAHAQRLVLNFNPDWLFTKSDPAGAASPEFDDSAWSRISTPHSFNDTDTFDNWSLPGHKGEQDQWSGRTWYRKHFLVPAEWTGKRVFVEFEAARQVAEVYLNGVRLGACKTGFTPFGFDLTPHLRQGVLNVLAVMVDNRFAKDPLDVSPAGTGVVKGPTKPLAQLIAEQAEAVPERLEDLQADQIPWNNPHWHPAHGGLYRNVRLYVTDPLHITLPLYSFLQTEGPYAYVRHLSAETASLGIEVPVVNERAEASDCTVRAELRDVEGRTVLTLSTPVQTLSPGARASFLLQGDLAKPRLWEPEYPHLYELKLVLEAGGRAVDLSTLPLGLRSVRWDPLAGFFINGRHLKLHGWGQKPTDEWPGLASGLPDWLHEYTLSLMKEAGGNFVRWGHAAAGPAQIAAGDRLGIIALQPGTDGEGEALRSAWELRVQAFRDTLIYFRNSPSILIWEGGNQKLPREKVALLRGLMDRFDPHGGRAYAHRRADQVTAEFMDVGIGTEGGREIARLPVVEGEYDREESPRRVWDEFSPPNFGYPEAKGQTYQLTSEQFAVNQVSQYIRKLGAPEHCGGANWIFSDSTSGGRVAVEVARASGEVDGVRLPKDAYFACAALFRDEPQVHVIGHWSYPAGTHKPVYVVSNAAQVELFLNGRSLGLGKVSDRHLFSFPSVAWEPGELKAVASQDGRVVASHVLVSTSPAIGLRLTPLTAPGGAVADGADVLLFDVEAIDAQGRRCPTWQGRVEFELSGPALWRGGYNSGKLDSINHPWLDLEAGVNRVAVRTLRVPGTLSLRASAPGLAHGLASVSIRAFQAVGGFATEFPAMSPVRLPTSAPVHPAFDSAGVSVSAGTQSKVRWVGRQVKAFNYSGPSFALVHVESLAREGRNAYVDRESPLPPLPAFLAGADWVQAADTESLYHAVDLMQLEVAPGSVVCIAHDRRLPRPPWLVGQFKDSGQSLVLCGHEMTLFTRECSAGESLTLGPNCEDGSVKAANMYLVLVSAKP